MRLGLLAVLLVGCEDTRPNEVVIDASGALDVSKARLSEPLNVPRVRLASGAGYDALIKGMKQIRLQGADRVMLQCPSGLVPLVSGTVERDVGCAGRVVVNVSAGAVDVSKCVRTPEGPRYLALSMDDRLPLPSEGMWAVSPDDEAAFPGDLCQLLARGAALGAQMKLRER